jgi:hypothetical protein
VLAHIDETEIQQCLGEDPGVTWTPAGRKALVQMMFDRDAAGVAQGQPPMVLNVTELRGGWVEYRNLSLAAADESPAHPKNPHNRGQQFQDAACLSWLREHHARDVIVFDCGVMVQNWRGKGTHDWK